MQYCTKLTAQSVPNERINVIKRKNDSKIMQVWQKISKFASNAIKTVFTMKDLNRIKVVLVEKKKTNKWLAEQLGKDPATISKWCTNTSQPDLATLSRVAALLDVDMKDLLNSTKEEGVIFYRK